MLDSLCLIVSMNFRSLMFQPDEFFDMKLYKQKRNGCTL